MRSASGSETTSATTKKKFGKNLNKLVKPAAPPIVDRSSGSSRNGLLLLSTKRNSSSSTTAPGTGGLLSNKGSSAAVDAGAIATTHHLPYESKPASTHDVLLSAVVGAAQAEAQQPRDAWGVAANKDNSSANNPQTVSSEADDRRREAGSNENGQSLSSPSGRISTIESEQHVSDYYDAPAHPYDRYHHHQQHDPPEFVMQTSNWDEYGGRGEITGGHQKVVDVDGATTDSAVNYGDNIMKVGLDDDVDDQGAIMARKARDRAEKRRSEEDVRMIEQKERAARRLQELDEKRAQQQQQQHEEEKKMNAPGTPPRKAWDMTRSGSRGLWEPEQLEDERRTKDRSGSSGNKDDGGSGPESPHSGPVIHLSSYEDRDRGERNASAAPRMLYDPKSGSMVAVKSRDETGTSSRKKSGGGGKKGRNIKDRVEPSSDNNKSESAAVVAREFFNDAATKSSRKQKRGGDDSKIADCAGARAKPSANPVRKLPRTCGVLYTRDDKGVCYCADDCDGDLGYGAHSVPGGRTRNPAAYAEYVKQHQQSSFDEQYENMYDDANYSHDGIEGDVPLYSGFGLDGEEEGLRHEPLEYVRANDRLELVTGVDESPTLKPTAKEWAPSSAALAAAAAAITERANPTDKSIDSLGDNEEEDGDGDDDDDGPLGLGFDPTRHMDFVMQSPSAEAHDENLDSVAISSLSLEPTAYPSAGTTPEASDPRHIFAFGTSGTWGVSMQPNAETGSDWRLPSAGGSGGLFDASVFRGSIVEDTRESFSFLNIPSSSSDFAPEMPNDLPTIGEGSTTTTGD